MTLELVNSGKQCEIVEIRHCGGCGGSCHTDGHGHGHAHASAHKKTTRAEEMGLRVGNRVEMLHNDGNHLLVRVNESRMTIDRRMAMKIMVRV
jgi:ferrous iron transport protein A